MTAAGDIRVGIGGWTFAPWRGGTFYPEGLVQRRELEYASRQVTAIEINGTFHRAQSPATYARWRDEVPPGFVFSAKAPRRIVQARRLAATGPQVEDFIGGIAALGDALGPLLWAFEPGRPADRGELGDFVALLPDRHDGRRLRHVLDVRDADLADAGLVALARSRGMALAFTDAPDRPSFADLTADFVYARLRDSRAGEANGYPAAALDRWAARARRWAAGGEPDDLPRLCDAAAPAARRRDVFVFFIGAAKQRNPAAAMALLARLGAD